MKRLTNYLILLGFTVVFLTCREKSLEVQVGMLPGKYCFNEGQNNDSLILYNNNSYLHKYAISKTEVFESKGEWQYDSVALKISFHDFIFYNETGPTNKTGGVWHSKVHLNSEGELRLIYSRENGIFYYKR